MNYDKKMNKLLEKFIKKIEKIKKYGILYKDEEQVLIAIPVEIEIEVSCDNMMSFTPFSEKQKRQVTVCCLCSPNAEPSMKKVCKTTNINVVKLTEKSSSDTYEEVAKVFDKKALDFYNLHTKLGDGHI